MPAATRSASAFSYCTPARALRLLALVLAAVIAWLAYALWFDPQRGLQEMRSLRTEIADRRAQNARLSARNATLRAEIAAFKEGLAALEERARLNLGMIREDETFFHILQREHGDKP